MKSKEKDSVVVFWFRRDLRLFDNHGLYEALNAGVPVLPVFIFDPGILERLNARNDARVSFIYDELRRLKGELEKAGSSLRVFYASPTDAFRQLIQEYVVKGVYFNGDYEPYALDRDRKVRELLEGRGIAFRQFKDQVIFEKEEVLKGNGTPYTVFTPYSRRWKQVLQEKGVAPFPSEKYTGRFLKTAPFAFPRLEDTGFEENNTAIPPRHIDEAVIRNYEKTRDIPGKRGTTRLGVHLRFGTVSIRECVLKAREWSETFLNELIWRDFYSMILWHFPHVTDKAFKPGYAFIAWRNDEQEFKRWCQGETGFPMVDAGMRELNETGFMHNRVRMITAGFLTKDLLIDWRWGEAYFAEKLLDFELASNNGNWQWAAGTGCDAAPWFRIFNPETQQKKFDPDGTYVSKWVPEYGTSRYARPLVDHRSARERALKTYKAGVRR